MYDKEKIEMLRNEARHLYLRFYISKGFTYNESLPLRIHFDPTLSFVNCSICHFKKAYLNDEELMSYCVTQPALRTNTYKIIHSKEELKYTASLEMLGTFLITCNESVISDFKKQMLYQAEFLNSYMNENFCFLVKISPRLVPYLTENLIKHLNAYNVEILLDQEDLCWNYGIDGIIGIGTDWLILKDGVQYEFGNVIILYKNGIPIGIESGGSIEVLLQSKCRLPHKIYTNTYCNEWMVSKIEAKSNLIIKYFDALNVISYILWTLNNCDDVSLKLLVVLEQYIRALKSIMCIEKINYYDLEEDIMNLGTNYDEWSSCPEKLYQAIRNELDNQWDMSLLVTNYNKRINKKKIKTWRGISELERNALEKFT